MEIMLKCVILLNGEIIVSSYYSSILSWSPQLQRQQAFLLTISVNQLRNYPDVRVKVQVKVPKLLHRSRVKTKLLLYACRIKCYISSITTHGSYTLPLPSYIITLGWPCTATVTTKVLIIFTMKYLDLWNWQYLMKFIIMTESICM